MDYLVMVVIAVMLVILVIWQKTSLLRRPFAMQLHQ